MPKEVKYVQVKIPQNLALELEKFVGWLGFSSRADIVNSALRTFLLDYERFMEKYTRRD